MVDWRSKYPKALLPVLLLIFNGSVNVFYRLNQEHTPPTPRLHTSSSDEVGDTGPEDDAYIRERAKQEREFKIGSIGFADSFGILLASVLAVPTEVMLCRAQVGRGKTFCSEL